MKLYEVTIRKPKSYYVVSTDAEAAYQQVRAFLYKHDWFFWQDRELLCIKLLAEAKDYPDCDSILLMQVLPAKKKHIVCECGLVTEVRDE